MLTSLRRVFSQEFGLKPMNCPGHCIMFRKSLRSYRELPMRFGDFGVLHRNELSGALTGTAPRLELSRSRKHVMNSHAAAKTYLCLPLTRLSSTLAAVAGLTRVRRFQQDDGHIFCTVAQIKQEVASVLDFIMTVYKYFARASKLLRPSPASPGPLRPSLSFAGLRFRYFGMTFALKLSTRPENALGEIEVWDKAEAYMTSGSTRCIALACSALLPLTRRSMGTSGVGQGRGVHDRGPQRLQGEDCTKPTPRTFLEPSLKLL